MNDPYPTISPQPSERNKAAPELPSRIGRYRVQCILGQGGFGIVYLAHDDQLQRRVAIKVPHRHLVSRPEDAQAYLTEARTVASLDHPNIVSVYDVGSNEEQPFFVVSKYIEGATLAKKIRDHRLSLTETVELVAKVAETLHYAHRKGLVHRDIKPGNILLDGDGKPFVADFGLALREPDVGKGAGFAGTPAYMSPEQAKGEGHRVDGRSDLFSLGIVFYELLTGRRPFNADALPELREQIISLEVRPPRQWDDAIPKELERICLKALSKRASDRYSTGKDMADDLRHFFDQATEDEKESLRSHVPLLPVPSPLAAPTPVPSPLPTPNSDSYPLKIVPKGMRSFDAHDADFFLELLPGPRDREGLPDSIRFWKTRIEETDLDGTFSVGLIYGPSGCGKSSWVKAGLLPRLAGNVVAVYVEAVSGETETRLLNGLRKRCPALPENLCLKEAPAALRRGEGVPAGKKVLIVLDQFEQWLHANEDKDNAELVYALRQCDGSRVQCIVLVRDDFWLAVSRFVRDLEVDLVPGRNIALVDLFDLDHARKVLAAFGRAFGKLPEKSSETNKDQRDFLIQAVSSLSQENKVICVRLALFAEMMKGRPWKPATLKEVGGAEGVGVTFLEDTFSSPTANPKHRLHQKSARAVLKALLLEAGTNIKGHICSQQDLLKASGLASYPKEFEDLLRILDGELRLITPTDPEGKEEDGEQDGVRPRSSGTKYYQLTHDYLVPSLRDWLTRKQKETRRGRAELLLADRTAVWITRPENRQLPLFSQWLRIRCLTRKKIWTHPQRKMMRKAARYYVTRGLVLAGCLLLLSFVGYEGYGRLKSETLLHRLLDSSTANVPKIIKEIGFYRRWVDPLLHVQAQKEDDERKQLHVSLALLPRDPGQVPYLCGRLLKANPEEVSAICQILKECRQQSSEDLWALMEEDPRNNPDQRFRAACALAHFLPYDDRWQKVGPEVAAKLVAQETFEIASWTALLEPVGEYLLPTLAELLADQDRRLADIRLIATIYGKYAKDLRGGYDYLENRLSHNASPAGNPDNSISLAKRKANLAVALMINGRSKKVWELLKHNPDSTARSFLIERLDPSGVDWKVLADRVIEEKDVSAKRAILLSLGQYSTRRLTSAEEWDKFQSLLLDLYRKDRDPGIHSAVAWLLRKWNAEGEIKRIDKQFMRDEDGREHIREEMLRRVTATPGKAVDWYVNSQGQTMVVISKAGKVLLDERPQLTGASIDYSFEIGATDVTVEQFRRFRKEQGQKYEPKMKWRPAAWEECPAIDMTWHEAAAYCNWLSHKEKLETCYEDHGKRELLPKANILSLSGYRLPTEREWEYACQANSAASYAIDRSDELTIYYGWSARNSDGLLHPVGRLKPNDFGLFDMYGNLWHWCNDNLDRGSPKRVALGGGWFSLPGSNRRRTGEPDAGNALGFRLARTLVGGAK